MTGVASDLLPARTKSRQGVTVKLVSTFGCGLGSSPGLAPLGCECRENSDLAVALSCVFWARGFEAASGRELAEAMGMTAASRVLTTRPGSISA